MTVTRVWPLLGALVILGSGRAAPPGSFVRAEEGLEAAVGWKWEVKSSATPAWASSNQESEPTPAASAETQEAAEALYIVKQGDALAKIARHYRITVDQLKRANDLKSDLIRIGQELRIPTAEEIALMPAPTPPPSAKTSAPQPGRPPAAGYDPDVLLLQIYLDRRGFSPGPIDGQSGLRFQKLMFAAQGALEGGGDFSALIERARAEIPDLFTTYTLRLQDLRFIDAKHPSPTKKKLTPAERDAEFYRRMTSSPDLLYHSAWDFVAERYHCEERFLRTLNPTLKANPQVGTPFCVPNIRPFEIENLLVEALQPPAGGPDSIKAIMADLSQLEIYKNDRLIAVFPAAIARPGLRGRGEWFILDAIPLPRLETFRERREPPRPTALPDGDAPRVEPTVLAQPEVLGPGPRNPLGVVWINLAKSTAPQTPIPYGLHGTSIPDRMASRESLGGFRLTNWDIVRATRLLPPGTPLRWRRTLAKPTAPAPPPSQMAPPGHSAPPQTHPQTPRGGLHK